MKRIVNTPLAAGFGELHRALQAEGLMDRRPVHSASRMLATVAALAAGWVALLAAGDSWWALAVAGFLGIAAVQVVFIGHDAGHHQLFSSRRANRVVGLVLGDLLSGLSFGWWVPKHGAHHAHPNTEDRDPDIGGGVIAFTAAHARPRAQLSGWAVRHQATLVVPLLLLEGIGLHLASLRFLHANRSARSSWLEAALLAAHAGLYLAATASVLSPGRAVAFVAVQQGVFGFYLGSTFAPNHKGMPIVGEDDTIDFVRRQVLTARNVRGGRLVAFALGGLNHQIEHHLFPTMPRANLRRAEPAVRDFCLRHSLPYAETTLLASYRCALGHLRRVGAGLDDNRLAGAGSGSDREPQLQVAT